MTGEGEGRELPKLPKSPELPRLKTMTATKDLGSMETSMKQGWLDRKAGQPGSFYGVRQRQYRRFPGIKAF